MEQPGLHPELETRLTVLAARIAELRTGMGKMTHAKKAIAACDMEELERRFKLLEERLHQLNSEGPGFLQGVKGEVEAVADDLMGRIDDFVARADSRRGPGRPPKQPHQS